MTEAKRQRRRFRWSFKELLPSWLREGEGEGIWHSIGWLIDGALDRMYYGHLLRMPSYAPTDAFPNFEQDRRIRRGINEPAASYRMRLIGWLAAARVRGNMFALLKQVREYMGGNGIRVRSVDASGNWYTIDRDGTESYSLGTLNWHWDGVPNPPNWARFWIIIYPELVGSSFKPWDLPPPLDGSLAFDGSWCWGSTADPEEVDTLRKIIYDEKPVGQPEWCVYYFYDDDGPDPDAFDPASPAPDGTWWSYGAGEPHDLNRVTDAAYMVIGPSVTPYGAMISDGY